MSRALRRKVMASISIAMTVFISLMIILIALTIILSSSFIVTAAQPFNVEIELPDSYQNVNPGSDVWFTVKLLNLDNLQRVDVTLNYDIINSAGESMIHNSKTVAIETQASFVADLQVPAGTPPGDYSINVVVNSSLGESRAKTALIVSIPDDDLRPYYIGAGVAAMALLIFLLIKSKPLLRKIKLRMKIGRIVNDKLRKK
jgi:hypothetical protein